MFSTFVTFTFIYFRIISEWTFLNDKKNTHTIYAMNMNNMMKRKEGLPHRIKSNPIEYTCIHSHKTTTLLVFAIFSGNIIFFFKSLRTIKLWNMTYRKLKQCLQCILHTHTFIMISIFCKFCLSRKTDKLLIYYAFNIQCTEKTKGK